MYRSIKENDIMLYFLIKPLICVIISIILFTMFGVDISKGDFEVKNYDLWDLANKKRDVHRFSTLFTAQNVRDLLSTDEGLNNAIEWCKNTAVTHVYIESYRDGYTAERSALEKAKKFFIDNGIDVSGCVTTTQIGKKSTGWNAISCFTNISTQDKLQEIFEYTASMFDEIMIDDFWFTDCECDECKEAKGDQSWSDYRCDLMVKLSRDRILKPSRKVNPNVKIIIKYPQWYDDFHNRGYEVIRETEDFDKIWVGTETRDPDDKNWGQKAQYEAYYIMRWLSVVGGEKTGGGWYDPYGTHPQTYVEQARQTILADAKESLLFCYGSLLENTGPANVEKLRTVIPSLFELAEIVKNKQIKGIYAPKPPNSDPHKEQYVFDFVGMMGLPLVPVPKIDPSVESAFFSVHALKDSQFVDKLKKMIAEKKPLLITDGLRDSLKGQIDLKSENIIILEVNSNPRSLMNLSKDELLKIRKIMLKPLNMAFDAPNKVSLYLIGDNHIVIENFNDEDITAILNIEGLKNAKSVVKLPIDAKININHNGRLLSAIMSPRSMVAIEIEKAGN
jgi:hypothetical protein